MKMNKTFISGLIIATILAALVFSCEGMVGLGPKLDLQGPIVELTAPNARQAGEEFVLEGTIWDHSAVEKMEITAKLGRNAIEKQWRYLRGAGWQVSEDSGASWAALAETVDGKTAKWTGSESSANWVLPITMPASTAEGEYMFVVQAWDIATMTDDNSLKTRILIFDRDPPLAEVYNPILYSKYSYDIEYDEFLGDDGAELETLYDPGLTLAAWRQQPALLEKFLTREFRLQWQITDNNDLGSLELRFYRHDVPIDGLTETQLPDTHIYRHYESAPKPNGAVWVPDLTDASGTGIRDPLNYSDKTIIKVVALCADAAGHLNQEKVLGYFVYWPEAREPWITYLDGMEGKDTEFYKNYADETAFKNAAYMIYPSRSITANAFQAQGVSKVEYSLHRYEITGSNPNQKTVIEPPIETGTRENPQIGNEDYSTIFSWEFTPPARPANYVVRATAFDFNGNAGAEHEAAFWMKDVTYPDFYTPVRPSASEPLFQFIGRPEASDPFDSSTVPADTIRISGKVSDATAVESLTMVWINPASRNYAAMSQLAYFRDQSYDGWRDALRLNATSSNATALENPTGLANPPASPGYPYDTDNKNRLWRLKLTAAGEEPGGRKLFNYSVDVPLSELNISSSGNPLKSQMFLLRVANPDGRATIITYAPQGDELSPQLGITNVLINSQEFLPNKADTQMEKFAGGETITINGTWEEDSVEYLPIATNFKNNLTVTVNGIALLPGNVTVTQTNATDTTGTWAATVTVGEGSGQISKDDLRDTFVVSVDVSDIGGNKAEAGSAWLIKSDTLRLLRISSEAQDGTFNAGKPIRIFLEFNKAVQLTNAGSAPTLTLNAGTNVTATYDTSSGINTRQYFNYNVVAGHDTTLKAEKYLNVTGLSTSVQWTAANYPLTWSRGGAKGSETYEEVRVTTVAGHNGGKPSGQDFYACKIPVSTNSGDTTEYPFTLVASKNIEIDTAAPTVTSITSSNQAGYYGTGSEIYITVEFNEPVKLGTTTPRLTLAVTKTSGTAQTDPDSIRVNGKEMTFVYKVVAGDHALTGDGIVISTYSGANSITDLAGTPLAANGISSIAAANRTLANRYVDTLNPTVPTIRLLSANNTSSVVTTDVSNATRTGTVSSTAVNLVNVYNDNLWLAIEGSATNVGNIAGETVGKLEYSINGGTSWVNFNNITNTPWPLPDQPGTYNIQARQTDRAGNISAATATLTFNWDKGALVSRISSSAANGTYTHVAGRNSIPITVYFRKSISVTATTGIRLNAQLANNDFVPDVTAVGTLPQNNVSQLTFTYTVANGHKMPAGANVWLDVTQIMGITARDTDGVLVTQYLTALPDTGKANRLNENKEIRVETGDLTRTAPTFIADNAGGDGYNDQTNANFHGIRTDDGSYWTTLEIPFNHNIYKGSGDIKIEQIAGTTNANRYRLPAVLTESQYNRFRSVSGFDTYYTKGTNGYINNTGSDTTVKYVLNYANVPSTEPTGNLATFATAFRQAEGISINVNSAAVTIVNTSSTGTLRVRLSGSNAPQVPGATYNISFPAGLVTDNLSNSSTAVAAADNVNVNLRGVAKPFVRIRKTQDTIAVATGGANAPRLAATQPFQTAARIDCRTPNSTITYNAAGNATTVTGNNWSATGTPADTTTTVTSRPTSTTGTSYTNGAAITVGDNNNYNGYVWWIRAQAVATVDSTQYTNNLGEEVAYRTAITYQLRNGTNAITASGSESILANGDQVWIRGGDAIGSSSIPGFPLTWEDSWTSLANKRAGIRLMTKTNTTAALNNSEWKFLTWEINATAYVDFIRGNDADSSANIAWQYGPKNSYYQRAGWTAYKDKYPIYPGKHRWCDAGQDHQGKGAINFSGTPLVRDTYANNNPNPYPGVNTAY